MSNQVERGARQRLARLVRRSLIADEGSSGNSSLSSQGGVPLGLPGEAWPVRDGQPLFPILSIYTPELPFIPEFLTGGQYWVLFIQRDEFNPVVEDGSLVVRRYAGLAGLVPLVTPEGTSTDRLGFTFRPVDDYPSTFTYDHILGSEVEENVAEQLANDFRCHSGIKLGGWPLMIQGTAFLMNDQPDFQIQLDCTELYTYADSGIGYVYADLQAVIWETM